MRGSVILCILGIALLASPITVQAKEGATCVACTLAVTLVEQVALSQRLPIAQSAQKLCGYLAPKIPMVQSICQIALGGLVPAVEQDFRNGKSPDFTCHQTLQFCKGAEKCHLFSSWPPVGANIEGIHFPGPQAVARHQLLTARNAIERVVAAADLGEMENFNDVVLAMFGGRKNLNDKHQAIFDDDQDRFSTVETLRGTHWRGKDCNDSNPDVYPGRKDTTYDPFVDHNCNGIRGRDESGKSYEDKFCAGSQQRGIVALGDSATAHFSIPAEWLHAATMTNDTFQNVLTVLTDEADWPQCSSWTAYEDPSKCPTSTVPSASVYSTLRERNRCNHRDYQNLGVNGAKTKNMAPPKGNIEQFVSRKRDHPALVFYSLVGNDVCNGSPDFEHMTKPADFERDVLSALDYLDERLPPNSYVVFMGLLDGRVLYDAMHDREHPIGGTTYNNLYEYLICLGMTPCWGWLNPNATVRAKTFQRVEQLNAVYPKIIKEHSYKNFKMHYVWTDLSTFVEKWKQQGHDAAELIELVDGFHPSTTGAYVIGSEVVRILEAEFPEALGPRNPFNDDIVRIFGDQGGH